MSAGVEKPHDRPDGGQSCVRTALATDDETGGALTVVDHAGWGDETTEVEMAVDHGSLANTAGQTRDLVPARPVPRTSELPSR
jgi:hypothetical protein